MAHDTAGKNARRTKAVLALLAAAGAAYCGTNEPSAPAGITGIPTGVTIAPADTSILQGGTFQFRTAITDSAGRAIAGLRPFAVPALADGFALRDTLLYVGTYQGGTVVEFNLRTRTISRTFSVGGVPQKVALSPDASTLYIANQAGYVQFWNLTTGTQVGGNLALPGGGGYGIARNPANGLLYVSTASFGGGNIHIVNPTTRTLLKSINAGGSTRRVVFNASGSVGFVTNEGGWVDFLK